jgi:hypothetical protein
VATTNQVDDTKWTRPLIKALHQHVDACAETLTDLPEERRTPVAAAWVHMSACVAWAEAHYLIDPWLSATAYLQMRRHIDARPDGMRQWLTQAVAALAVHPSTACLMDPRWTPCAEGTPSEEACRALVEYWITDAPRLAYGVSDGPASISGWIIGDLLQDLSADRRKAHALVQTPWWVADFILDRTLIPAANDFPDTTLMTIDPTCGTGHFLVRTIDYLWELYTTGALAGRQSKEPKAVGWQPVSPAAAIERIVAGVTGVELDPLTTAVARLRTVVAVGDLMHRAGLIPGPHLRLDAIPHIIRPRIAVGDSLLGGRVSWQEYAQIHPQHAAIYGNPELTETPAIPEQPVGQLGLFVSEASHA